MKREHLWALLALVIAIALAYILVSLSKDVQSEARQQCMDKDTKERIRELSQGGVDDGLRKHVANLFVIWVQDAADQPARAKIGMRNGINAYLRARADAVAWEPPTCGDTK